MVTFFASEELEESMGIILSLLELSPNCLNCDNLPVGITSKVVYSYRIIHE